MAMSRAFTAAASSPAVAQGGRTTARRVLATVSAVSASSSPSTASASASNAGTKRASSPLARLAAAGRSGRRAASITTRASAAPAAATSTPRTALIPPHGNGDSLVDLMLPDEASKAAAKARATKTIELSDRNACDVELLIVGGFSPLKGFMDERDYTAVVQTMRLSDGLLFGLPVVMDTDDDSIKEGDVVLLTYKGQDLAVLDVSSKWTPNKPVEARQCYGTTSIEHPAVQMITMERGKYYLGGAIQGLGLPKRPFACATPREVRAGLPVGQDVLAFQCRNPIHRAHYELFTRALDASNVSSQAVCLVHPTVGPTQDDDIPGEARVRTYEVLKEEVGNPRLRWAYLPYSMHMAGPREAVQHMAIRKNYGCTHFIIGRDMAGCKSSLSGDDFYTPYEAQDMARRVAPELGMDTVPSLNITYTEEKGYVTADVAEKENLHQLKLSGTKFRQMLRSGEDIPEWFAFKSVVKVLRETA